MEIKNIKKYLQTNDQNIDVWKAFKNGDQQAFAEIYKLYINDLLSYGYRVTSDRQLIKDSIQDLFLNLWQTKQNLTDTTSIRFYLYRSLRNRIIKNLEKTETINLDATNIFDNIIGALSIEDDIIETEHSNQQLLKLRQAIKLLSKRQQEVLQLRYYHDFNNDEICQLMNLSNQSVRNLLHNSISELRHYLNLIISFLSLCFFLK